MYTMTPITQSGTPDANSIVKGQATKWAQQAIAFARIIALQLPEWIKLRNKGVKVIWRVADLKELPYPPNATATEKINFALQGDMPVFAVYFYVPGYTVGVSGEDVVLNNVPLETIVLDTVKPRENATATE